MMNNLFLVLSILLFEGAVGSLNDLEDKNVFEGSIDGMDMWLEYMHNQQPPTLKVKLFMPGLLSSYENEFWNKTDIQLMTDNMLNSPADLYYVLRRSFYDNNVGNLKFSKQQGLLIYTITLFTTPIIWKFPLVYSTENFETKLDILWANHRKTVALDLHPSFIISDGDNSFQCTSNKKKCIYSKSRTWRGLFGSPTFFQQMNQEFSIQLNKTKNLEIMVGVAVLSSGSSNVFHTTSTSWMIYLKNGNCYHRGHSRNFFPQSRIPILDGDIITIRVDMKMKFLSMLLNGISFGVATRIIATDEQIKKLSPAVEFYDTGDSVRFV